MYEAQSLSPSLYLSTTKLQLPYLNEDIDFINFVEADTADYNDSCFLPDDNTDVNILTKNIYNEPTLFEEMMNANADQDSDSNNGSDLEEDEDSSKSDYDNYGKGGIRQTTVVKRKSE